MNVASKRAAHTRSASTCSGRDTPLFGDERYGGDRILKGTTFNKYKQFIENCFAAMPRQALHAKSLGFQHPTTGEQVYFESELPEDFRTVLAKWDAYAAAGLAEE